MAKNTRGTVLVGSGRSMMPLTVTSERDNPIDCTGLVSPVDGLVIARIQNDAEHLSLTHLHSGLAIAFWSPDAAEAVAAYVLEAIAPMAIDWTADTSTVFERLTNREHPGVPHPTRWSGSLSWEEVCELRETGDPQQADTQG